MNKSQTSKTLSHYQKFSTNNLDTASLRNLQMTLEPEVVSPQCFECSVETIE